MKKNANGIGECKKIVFWSKSWLFLKKNTNILQIKKADLIPNVDNMLIFLENTIFRKDSPFSQNFL